MISVVIPAFDEAAALPATLSSLRVQAAHDVIVVDAGSTDSTASLAHDAGARVISSARRQRAAQMNLGASVGHGDALLFLHADTRLPPGALRAMEAAFQHAEVAGGGFARRYNSPSLILRATCALAEARTQLCGWFLGDQAIFVRRTVFTALGGFSEWDVFEDLDFSRRLARAGRVVTLRPPVVSSARRFNACAARTTWRDFALTVRFLASARQRENVPSGSLCSEP